MTTRLMAALREAPTTVPAFGAIALFVIWATSQAGYPITHWAPGGVILLGLLGVAASARGVRWREVPLPVRVAVTCLAGYTALSFLSILWAAVPGDAWEGADRTLLYLVVFALFALWRQNGLSAALLLAAWTLAIIGLAVFVVAHLDAAGSAALQRELPEARLLYPSGYANANAAQWLMAFWPALLLARSERLPWALRGVLAGGAVLLALVALLSLSRGALFATPVMLVLVFALLPRRLRTFAVLAPVAAGIAAATPAVLRVGNDRDNGAVVPGTLHAATEAILIAAVCVGGVVALAAALETRRTFSDASRARFRRGLGAAAIATLVAVLAGGWAAAGDPITRARHAWDTFKSPAGYAANGHGNRLLAGLGSQRYDVYRVALDEFVAHPLIGIGADNFQQAYLAHGRTGITPHYPHSVELRTLAQTGLIGSLIALVGFAAALLAAARACRWWRRGDPLAAAVATAALGGFAYWVVHGSVDWFFEFAGLGAPAFAMLGLACALSPRPRVGSSLHGHSSRRGARRAITAAAALATVAAAAALAAPWLSQLEVQDAAREWPQAPRQAYSRLSDAAQLNPLSDEPYVLAGSIALRLGEVARAEREFQHALSRTPGDDYATLELGAIASAEGQRQRSRHLLERAVRLFPHDQLTRQALAMVRGGRAVDLQALNRSIYLEAQ